MSEYRYKEFGIVKGVSGCIAAVIGLQNCFLGQLIKFGYGTEGIIMGCDLQEAKVLIVKENEPIIPGSRVTATLEPFNMPTGNNLIGRIINPLGEASDGQGAIKPEGYVPYFNACPPIMERLGLSRTLETGVKLVDTMLPIGKGQRMLILGDKMVGKTTVMTDIILNQKGKDVICVYCAIGKTRSAMIRVVDLLKEKGAFDYTIILQAPASSSPGQQYLAPYAACAVAESFMLQGKDVFVGFDDFTKHAWAYRELSLLMQVPPGRDSYPGDIFYLHSRMIERAAQCDDKRKCGSITFIAIVELLEGDLTAYVPTNLVSMTDGQIVLSMPLFNEGFRPAVDVGLSVSRVGSKVQWKAMKKVSAKLRLEFIQFKELLRISKLQTGGQSEETREKLASGKVLQALLTQTPNSPMSQEVQVAAFFAKDKGLLAKFENPEMAREFLSRVYEFLTKNDPEVLPLLRKQMDLTQPIQDSLLKWLTLLADEIAAKFSAKQEAEEAV